VESGVPWIDKKRCDRLSKDAIAPQFAALLC